MLDKPEKGIFSLKEVFFGESLWVVGRFSSQIPSFRMEKHEGFLTYVQLTFMLHHRIHGFFTHGILSLEVSQS